MVLVSLVGIIRSAENILHGIHQGRFPTPPFPLDCYGNGRIGLAQKLDQSVTVAIYAK